MWITTNNCSKAHIVSTAIIKILNNVQIYEILDLIVKAIHKKLKDVWLQMKIYLCLDVTFVGEKLVILNEIIIKMTSTGTWRFSLIE